MLAHLFFHVLSPARLCDTTVKGFTVSSTVWCLTPKTVGFLLLNRLRSPISLRLLSLFRRDVAGI